MTGTELIPVPAPRAPDVHKIPMPVFFNNPKYSLTAIMLFPDDWIMARKYVAHELHRSILQRTWRAGVPVDPRYTADIAADIDDGRPNPKLVAKRCRQASACGQIVKGLFALVNRSREYASWEQSIEQFEHTRPAGTNRKGDSTLNYHLRRFQPVLHLCGAFELACEKTAQRPPPLPAERLMLEAMTLFEKLKAWDDARSDRGRRSDYLSGDICWRWWNMDYVDHGVPDIGIAFERLIPRGKGGRPRK